MRAALTVLLLLGFASRPAAADAGWFTSGDTQLRNDLLLLNDAEVIRIPVSQWPIPRAAVAYALQNGKSHFATNAAVSTALERVRARLEASSPARIQGLSLEASLLAGEAGLLRDFDTVGRESGELSGRANYSFGERAEISLNVTGAADPDDDRPLRADGSHASMQIGNWLLSANTLERWWGPGHEGSLILSNNARPMPTVMVERATARAFQTPWLSWLGPWRFTFGLSRMESEREDIDAPLFMTWRVSIMPSKNIELGFSRSAQFCGRQLVCDFDSFANMLAGNDNVGFDASPETEPGNQMAGFDIRWDSPLFEWPYAVYGQMIGEDESSYTPVKYLAQFGIEVWKPLADGGLVQVFTEYADTSCSAVSGSGPYFNCAYNQGQFNIEGYRYHGRVIGHTTDRDSRSLALGATLTPAGGGVWSATARVAELNRDGNPDPTDTLTELPVDYGALEVGWSGRIRGESIELQVGVESIETTGFERDIQPFGFVRWTHQFQP